MNLAILIASRSGYSYLLTLIGFTCVAMGLSGHALKIDLAQQYEPALIALPEMSAVLLACIAVAVLRPRLWIIDRLGVATRRWIPATAAMASGIVGSQLVLVAAASIRFPQQDWARSAANLLFLTGLAYLLTPFVGAFAGSGLILMLYMGLTCVQQMEPAVSPWSPLAISTTTAGGRWVIAIVAALAGASTTICTLGRTRRTWGQDLDLA